MQSYRCLTGIALALAAVLPAAAAEYGADFEQFCRGVRDRYAYFDSRPVDWPGVCADYGPFAAAAVALDAEDEPPFWRLVDRLAGLADLPERDLALMADLLAIVTTRRGPDVVYRRRVPEARGQRG